MGWAIRVCAVVGLLGGCLEPDPEGPVPPRGLVLPAGENVESIYDYPELSDQVTEFDGVGDLIPRVSGFANGPVQFWDFGEAPDNAAPIHAFYWGDLAGELGVDWDFQPNWTGQVVNVVDSIPGDPQYTPFWFIVLHKVTPEYAGQIIPSFSAIEEAVALGLLEPEPTLPQLYSNCPIVHRDVRLEVGLDGDGDDADGGNDGLLAPIPVFYRGMQATYFDFARSAVHGPRPLVDGTRVTTSHTFVLTRPAEPPLSELRRGVDMTGDADATDTNDVFPYPLSDENYTPLRHSWLVTVPTATGSIDTAADELSADLDAFEDLYASDNPLVANPTNVLAFEAEARAARNMPLQSAPGDL